MKGHNYTNPPCKKCGQTHIHPIRGKKPWNKGLKGSQIPWNKGLTMQTDKRVAVGAQKLAQTIQLHGRVSPNKGKITPWMFGNQNIAKRPEIRAKISASLAGQKRPWVINRNKSEAMRNFNRERLLKTWEEIHDGNRFILESAEHRALKMLAKEFLLSEGFIQVETERHVKFGIHCYKVDVYAKKNDERIAVECGDCSEKKLYHLHILCSRVIHIPYPVGGF